MNALNAKSGSQLNHQRRAVFMFARAEAEIEQIKKMVALTAPKYDFNDEDELVLSARHCATAA